MAADIVVESRCGRERHAHTRSISGLNVGAAADRGYRRVGAARVSAYERIHLWAT